MRRIGQISLACMASATFLVGSACSSENPTPNPARSDGGEPAEAGPMGDSFTGRIFDLGQKGKAVPAATVKLGPVSATSDAKGAYSAAVPLNTPFSMIVTAPGYYKLIEQETLLKGTVDRGKTFLPSNDLGLQLNMALPGYDVALGGVGVAIETAASCPDVTGATLLWTVEGEAADAGAERIEYFQSDFPNPTVTAAVKNTFPNALIYNVPPGKKITVTVKHPTCTAVAFPVDIPAPFKAGADSTGGAGTLTFTSATILTEAGKATSFVRVFLK